MKAARTWLGVVLALGVVSVVVPGGAGAAAPPPTGTTYVSDIAWTSATNGWGPVEINRSNGDLAGGDGRVVTLNGVTYQKGLGVHAVSSVKYFLGNACQLFQADVGVDDEVGSNGSVVFRLLGDGAQLYASGTMTGTSATKTVSVNLTGKVELELSVGDAGNGKNSDHADWANARVTCGGGSDTTLPTVTQTTPTGGASGVSMNASPTVTFSEPVQTSTVTTSTITLVKQGTQTLVAAVVSYDSPSRTATLDPTANLDPSSTYVATVKGGSSGVKDLAGIALAQDYVLTFTTSGAAQTTTYLSDLTWTSATNGYGPIEINRSNGESAGGDGRVMTLNGVTYQKGLGVHALSNIVYDLGGGCSAVEASVGVDDESGTNGSLIFRVYGDGTLLFDSGVMTGSTATATFNVSVTDVVQLRLNVDPNGVKTSDHADWANARVTCAGGSDTTPPTVTQTTPIGGASGVSINASPTVTFSEPVQTSTVTTSTITLVKQGTQTPVAAVVTYDSPSRTATLDPTANLDPSSTYVATVKGGSSGVKDLAGVALAQDYVLTFTTSGVAQTTTYLSDMTFTMSTNGWGPLERDESNGDTPAGDGLPLTLAGVTYAKGLGVHAVSDVRVALGGACTTFTAKVGIDDEVGSAGNVIFQVFTNGSATPVYDSGVMTGSTATRSVNVNVTGVNELRLYVSSNGSKNSDHADWADAFVACGESGPGLFAAPTPYAAGTNPHGVVAADLNTDGKRDLVVANAGASSVSVRLGNGDGTFGAESTFVTGTRPKNAAVADVNADGKPDLVTANQTASSLSVLLGNGDGTFQAKVDYAACSKPHEVAVADVSGDGKRDLAVACFDGSVISVLLGNGDGTFAAAMSFGAGLAPHSIVIEDFNGDGKGDLAVANHLSANVSVLLGNGNGTFQASVSYAVGSRPHSVRAGDLNGDARLDLVTANDGSNNVSVLLGNGNGTFQAASNYGAGKVPKSVAIADLNGDGKQDVVTANTAGNGDGVTGNPDGDNVSVLLGSGNGSLGAQTKYTVGLTPFSVFAADLNGDGKPDLVTANWDANTAAVLLHT